MASPPERLAVVVPERQTPWRQALPVAARLRDAGFAAWCVGGCVRDLLLGRAVHDIDLATDATPETVEGLFPKPIAVGKAFGVMVVVAEPGHNVEVATFRHDGRYLDGRRPEQVRFGTAEEDVARRDFTVNALLLDPIAGEVVDHVGGIADLRARLVRCVGDPATRLSEDRLRVLRALRFAATLAFALEPATWAAARACPVSGLSRERVMEEWRKALAGAPGAYLRLCVGAERLGELTPPLHGFAAAELAPTACALRSPERAEPPAAGRSRARPMREDAAMAAWLGPPARRARAPGWRPSRSSARWSGAWPGCSRRTPRTSTASRRPCVGGSRAPPERPRSRRSRARRAPKRLRARRWRARSRRSRQLGRCPRSSAATTCSRSGCPRAGASASCCAAARTPSSRAR